LLNESSRFAATLGFAKIISKCYDLNNAVVMRKSDLAVYQTHLGDVWKIPVRFQGHCKVITKSHLSVKYASLEAGDKRYLLLANRLQCDSEYN
jgi:hypothetical protein